MKNLIAALIFCTSIGSSLSAFSQSFNPNVWYRLTCQWQGEGKSLTWVQTAGGNSVQLMSSSSGAEQYWKIVNLGDGWFRLINKATGDAVCLNVTPDGNNRSLQFSNSAALTNQYWKLSDLGNGYYRITNRWQATDGRSIDIVNDGTNNQITLADTGPYSGQMWSIKEETAASTAINNTPVIINRPVDNIPINNIPINNENNNKGFVDPDEGSYIELPPDDLKQVIKWIAESTKDAKTEYCYKQSYGRGVGETLSGCGPNAEQDGALCYPRCAAGYDGVGPVCWQECPSGYRNDGAFCAKPASYGRGAGRVPDVSCPPGTPNKQGIGAAAWCDNGPTWPWNLKTAKAIVSCRGDEEMSGALCYPRCQQGYHAAGCCLCEFNACPPGMSDNGMGSCTKNSYGRSAGEPMGCRGGLEKDGALCYTPCRAGYHGVGPVCWQNCPSTQPVECAAGCAVSSTVCGEKTANMVVSVVMLAVNILTLGESSELTIAKSELTAALKAGKMIEAKAAMAKTLFAYARAFENLTTRQVARTLEQRLSRNAAKFVIKEYAKAHMRLAMQESFSIEDLRDLAGLDPTGVAEVVEAFTQSICPSERPFPTLSRSY